MPQRSSDLVETYSARALGMGALAIVVGGAATVMFVYRGDSGLPLAIVLALIAVLLLGYATFSLIQSRRVTTFEVICPMCRAKNGFTEAPVTDVTCGECHRTIPIKGGKLMPLQQVSCGACGESNYYSDRTKSLICEACGKEIAIARP